VVPFWAVIGGLVVIVVIVILIATLSSSTTADQSAPCSKFASVANGFVASVKSAHAGTTTTDQLTADVAALPAGLTRASAGASGDVARAMSSAASAATFYVGHRSDFAATTKLFDSFTQVQHFCQVAGSSITIG
jgi:hypothetical protein